MKSLNVCKILFDYAFCTVIALLALDGAWDLFYDRLSLDAHTFLTFLHYTIIVVVGATIEIVQDAGLAFMHILGNL